MNEILAIIPARSGSKGIPRKNSRLLGGKPLIGWTIAAAREATRVSRVLVSTDDADIAAIAREAEVDAPFVRPESLATDTARSVDVVLHALSWLDQNESYRPEAVVLLQPTSPLREAADIDSAIGLLDVSEAQSVVTVTPVEHPIEWLRTIGPSGELLTWAAAANDARRQDSAALYQLNGAVYVVRTPALLKARTFFVAPTLASVMPPERSIDIDTPFQFRLADLLMRDRAGEPAGVAG